MKNLNVTEISTIEKKIFYYINELCNKISNRHVGSPGNVEATNYFAKTIADFGFEIEIQEFDCIDWVNGEVNLQAAGKNFKAYVSPYSLSCNIVAPLVEISSYSDLESTNVTGKILLIRDELAREQFIPKHYPFNIPVQYPDILNLIEKKAPAAIIAATGRNPELTGAVYPFPLIEDGDFNIPSIYMTEEEGEILRKSCGKNICLSFESKRIPSKSCNVIAKKGIPSAPRIVICAHIDTKKNTPGALDNASGIAVLLAVAELLKDYSGEVCIEIAALNGEDYYAASGQKQYLALNEKTVSNILLAINMDLAGYSNKNTIYSSFGCSENIKKILFQILETKYNISLSSPWYASDHMIFVSKGRPAVVITSENYMELSAQITHTQKDIPQLIDYRKLVEISYAIKDLITEFSKKNT